MSLCVIAAGGTFDKHYDEIAGKLGFGASVLPAVIAQSRIDQPVRLETLPLLDSLDMQQQDRLRILDACRRVAEERIVVIHGTDTMPETAQVLGQAKLAKTIVLTGAMQVAHHFHQPRMRHARRRLDPEQYGFAVGMLDLVGRQVQIQRAALGAEASRDPPGQQVDRGDHAIAAIAVKDNGSGSDGFHEFIGKDKTCKDTV